MTIVEIAPNVQRRISSTIFASSSLIAAAQIASFTLMPPIAASLAGSDYAAGMPSTLSSIGRAVVAYPIGWIMGRAGRRVGLTLGLSAGVLGALLSVIGIILGSFWMFAIGAGLAGMARGAIDLGRYAAAEVYPDDRHSKVIGMIVFAGTIGAVMGPLVVAPSRKWAGEMGLPSDTGPYLIAAVLTIIAMILLTIFLRPDPLDLSKRLRVELPGETADIITRSLGQIFGDRSVQMGTAAMMIGQAVMVLIMVITPLHMSHSGHSDGAISLVIMAHTLGMFGLSWMTGWLIGRFGTIKVIGVGALILMVAAVVTPYAASVLSLAVALFLLGLGWNFCYVAGSSLMTYGLDVAERSKAQGTSDMLASGGAAVASLASGLLFGLGTIMLVAAFGLAMSLALAAALILYRRLD